jgi:CDP-diacylglycerol--glycerol-3-phosphate 3-phosphatidyltransferase
MSKVRGVPDHVGDPVGQRRVLTGPNAVTAFRLLLVPVLAWLLFAPGTLDDSSRWWATGVFVLAAVTDFIDGAWARHQGSVTTLGKIADPIADKAITGVALIGLSWWGLLPWWVTVVILARELIVTAARFVVIRHGVIAASRGGKAKTIAQIIAIALFLAPLGDAWQPAQWGVMAIAIVLTLVTGGDYLVRAARLRSQRTHRVDSGVRSNLSREDRR